MDVYNFSAGPSVLPNEVKQQITKDIISYQNSGMSILEISHRSSLYTDMLAKVQADLRDLMKISDEYAVLFLPGGATLQFTNLALNLATKFNHVAYLNSGHWAQKAIDAAKKVPGLQVDVIDSTNEYLPDINQNWSPQLDYVHLTTNNTIEGTTYHQIPELNEPLVADMSSNILAQPYDVNQFDLIYAGAQKNMGIAGLAIVIVKKERLKDMTNLSDVMNFWLEEKKNSEPNTPPVFSIYVAGLVFDWLKKQGGVAGIYQQNKAQAKMLYDYIDQSNLFGNQVKQAERSLTNIVFSTGNSELDKEFIAEAADEQLISLAGHRLVGGMRASLYNAMPTSGVEKLLSVMQKFEQNHKGDHYVRN